MRRRSKDESVWGRITAYDSEVFWIPAIILAVFGWFITTLIYCSVVSDQNDQREGEFKIVRVLEDARQFDPAHGVKELATSLIRTHKDDLGVSELDNKDFREEVRVSANTGSIPKVLTPQKTWGEFFPGEGDLLTSWLSLGILATLALMSCASSLCYAVECSERREYLADINLRKPSQVLFVLWTPILWPFYPISLIDMHQDAKRQARRAREARSNEVLAPEVFRRRLTEALDTIESISRPQLVLVDDRAGALEAYHRICSELAAGNVERRKRRLNEKIETLNQEATELSDTMRQTQRARTQAKADLQALEKIDPTENIPDKETAETQFNRLVALSGVEKVWPLENGIGLLVKARLEYNGKRYDLGDWRIQVTDKQVDGFEIRSGLQSGWSQYEYPAYRYGGGMFCFGERHPEMNDRCKSGHLLEAAIIAVECVNSVNEIDLKKVPKAFNKAPE